MERVSWLCFRLKEQASAVNRIILKRIYSKFSINAQKWSDWSAETIGGLCFEKESFNFVDGPVIGIDFRNTKCCVAGRDGNVPRIRRMTLGVNLAESFEQYNECFAGIEEVTNSENTLNVPKRGTMGFPSSFGLLRITAEMILKTQVCHAVIAVPAYFDDVKIQKVGNACKMAGFEKIRFISEPMAAALAPGLDTIGEHTVAVYNLNGETFDVSILKSTPGTFVRQNLTLSSVGDKLLGGKDFDMALMNFFRTEFIKQTGIDLNKNHVALQRLREAAVDAKHQLSQVNEVQIDIPELAVDNTGRTKDFSIKMTREKFENLVDDLLTRTIPLCEKVVKAAKINKKDIKEVLLIGGMTKMPKVRKIVEEIFKQPPSHRINTDEAVAVGAAMHGLHDSGIFYRLIL